MTDLGRHYLKAALLVAVLTTALIITGCGGGGGGSDVVVPPTVSSVVAPLAVPGPFAVACSNVSQDFTRVPAGDDVTTFWEGTPSATGRSRYVTDLLNDPGNTLSLTVNAPNNGSLFGSFAAQPVAYVVLVCYPTTANNPRPDYALPAGKVVPHMQTGAAAPIFADANAHYPVMLFSHGYSGSPLSSEYLAVLSVFASYGYVVVAPFHGDVRVSNLKIDTFIDAVTMLANLRDLTALEALRPLSMSAALDLVSAHPQWRDHIDLTQVGGFGASMGGETLMLMGGAQLTTNIGLSSTQVTKDTRLKAAVGYVPYFGQPFLPAFGRDQQGLDGVTLPYMGISGTADTTAPIAMTQQGLARLTSTRELISLQGVVHHFDVPSTNDIYTWSLTFFDAMVKGNAASRKQLTTMASVSGGGDDRVTIPYNGPAQ